MENICGGGGSSEFTMNLLQDEWRRKTNRIFQMICSPKPFTITANLSATLASQHTSEPTGGDRLSGIPSVNTSHSHHHWERI